MELFTHIREAVVNLFSAKLRSFLAILGVLVGTGSVVALISSSQLATAHALAQFKTLGTNLLSIYIRDNQSEQQSKQNKQFQLSDIPLLKQKVAQVHLVAPYTSVYQSMYYGSQNLEGQILGATQPFAEIAKVKMAAGRFVTFLDHHQFFCVVGNDIAKKIRESGQDPLLQQIRVGNFMFTVIGVMKSWPSNLFIAADLNHSVIVPLETSYLLDKNTQISNILLRLNKNPNIALAKKNIANAFKIMLPKKQLNFNSPEQIIKLVAKQRETYTWLLVAIGSISLIVGGIGVMNIMLVSVVERRKEIGIRMAIGARHIDVLRMFLIESILLTLFGGFLGVVVGVFASYVLAVLTHWQFFLYWLPVGLGFIVSVVVGILSGLYPAWRASKLDPIETLSSD